ncbi:hypothetical protein Bra3105_11005 [Brachybacterium halotolerans subsp. kimchii]|uniref:hypothetical protein n=1 Tax=Brachybacterium halotolerans TaxID=2795215 RepID=UPI001E4AD8B5|nr:hypothetical protein [Brachybacterium halotolerans]UEJ81374.1 hypothetical protein Bra3105_11005 [Brachybacterium halotolerans subsp. kimchii]
MGFGVGSAPPSALCGALSSSTRSAEAAPAATALVGALLRFAGAVERVDFVAPLERAADASDAGFAAAAVDREEDSASCEDEDSAEEDFDEELFDEELFDEEVAAAPFDAVDFFAAGFLGSDFFSAGFFAEVFVEAVLFAAGSSAFAGSVDASSAAAVPAGASCTGASEGEATLRAATPPRAREERVVREAARRSRASRAMSPAMSPRAARARSEDCPSVGSPEKNMSTGRVDAPLSPGSADVRGWLRVRRGCSAGGVDPPGISAPRPRPSPRFCVMSVLTAQ